MSRIKSNIAHQFKEIAHRKELDKNNLLILQQKELKVKFCANCGHMLL